MNLPDTFITTIQGIYGQKGAVWLKELPSLVEQASVRWDLQEVHTVEQLSYNYVAFAKQGQRNVVLKIGVPHKELSSEIAALQCFNGKGAVLLLEHDKEQGMMLLERLMAGAMLSTLDDDDAATHIAIDVMLKLRQPCSHESNFIQLRDSFKGFTKLRERYNGTTGPLDKNLVERAETSVQAFFAESYTPMLIHGDVHHYNILSSDRGWLAIDPKGVVGPAEYEVGPFLLNPHHKSAEELGKLAKRRMELLSRGLGIDKKRIQEWAIAHAVLSAWWGLEDNTDWAHAMACAKAFSLS